MYAHMILVKVSMLWMCRAGRDLPKVTPDVPRENVERSSKRLTRCVLAEPTVPVWLGLDISARLLRKLTGICLTVLARWGREYCHFLRLASNNLTLREEGKEPF